MNWAPATILADMISVNSNWYLLLAPLSIGIAVVYKTLKVRNVRHVPMAAVGLTATILVGMAVAAAALVLIYLAAK